MRMLTVIPLVFLTACASPGYKEYLQAQADANKQALEAQKPLIKLTAQPGQQITGLQSLEVYPPQQMPVIQQARENEWAKVIGQGLGIAGQVGSIYYGGKAAIGLASEIRQAGTAGYPYIQSPGAATTTTNSMSNSTGVLGSGTYQIDNTNPAQVVNPAVVDPVVVAPVVVQP